MLLVCGSVASPGALKPSVGDGIESSWSLVHTIPLFFLTSLYFIIYLCAPFLVCFSINNNNNNNRPSTDGLICMYVCFFIIGTVRRICACVTFYVILNIRTALEIFSSISDMFGPISKYLDPPDLIFQKYLDPL